MVATAPVDGAAEELAAGLEAAVCGGVAGAAGVWAYATAESSSVITTSVSVLSKQEANYQSARLEYLCYLISRAREPLCPINGVLTVTPFQLLRRGEGQCRELALAVREGALGRLTVERADGEHILASPLGTALEAAGFHATPRGLRLRG